MSVPRRQLANAIRALAMDAVQKANSGHPGMPMGMADIAEVLWNDHLGTTQPILSGPIVIDSSSRTVTVRCCCTRCCI